MRKLSLFALGLLLLASAATAQNTDIEALAGITFNFANPGARSMGMGGAFLGRADDASAAETNPAGLTILRKPEISIEARNYRMVQDLAVTGTYPDIVTQEFSSFSRRAEVQFGSIVLPFENFAIAAYYHQPINYQNAGSVLPITSGGVITQNVPNFYFPRGNPIGSSGPVTLEECFALPTGECFTGSILPFSTAVQVKLETYGLAGAWKMGNLSVGLSGRYHEFEEGAVTSRFFQGALNSIAVQATQLDPETAEVGKEDDVTFAGGFKWALSERFSIGGSYKQGAEFDAPLYLFVAGESEQFDVIADTKFHVPDIAGLGISMSLTPVLIINVDAVQVNYSNLTDDMRTTGRGTQTLARAFEAEDATEFHVGGEYFFSTKIPFAIRAGWWRDPAHSMRYVGPLNCPDSDIPEDQRLNCVAERITESILFPEPEDQDHFSVGVGLAWPSFQIDAAYDTSEGFKVGSLSGVVRF
jgi:long-chain fatty acid transport protein